MSSGGRAGGTSVDVTNEDPYAVLGIRADASAKEISSAYRRAALRWHPDKNPGDAHAAAMFTRVYMAHERLSDDSARAEVDALRRAAAQREERTREMDVKRRRMKETLERRESAAASDAAAATTPSSAAAAAAPSDATLRRMREEIDRLRKVFAEADRSAQAAADAARKKPVERPAADVLVKWSREPTVAWTEDALRALLLEVLGVRQLQVTFARANAALVSFQRAADAEKVLSEKSALRRKGLFVRMSPSSPSADLQSPHASTAAPGPTSTQREWAASAPAPRAPPVTTAATLEQYENDVLAMMRGAASSAKRSTT